MEVEVELEWSVLQKWQDGLAVSRVGVTMSHLAAPSHCEATLGDVQLWVCGDNGDILSCFSIILLFFFLNQLINSTMALLQQSFNCWSHEQEFK